MPKPQPKPQPQNPLDGIHLASLYGIVRDEESGLPMMVTIHIDNGVVTVTYGDPDTPHTILPQIHQELVADVWEL